MKVTAIMPTRNRLGFLPASIGCLLSQTWPMEDLELVVIDDSDDIKTCNLVIHLCQSQISYRGHRQYPLSGKVRTIGEKRNHACELASGEIIIHWDDDDWSAPGRIAHQVGLLMQSGKSVSGFHSMLFWDEEKRRASRYSNENHYALGTSLCYRREWWQRHLFSAKDIGEDNEFVFTAHEARELVSCDGGHLMVARIHSGNTSKNKSGFPEVPIHELPAEFPVTLIGQKAECVSTSSPI